MSDSSTGVFSGSVTGVGSGRYSIQCYWLIPNRNTDHHVGIAVLVRSVCVDCTKGLKCGSNGWIILGGGACEEALVFCTGLLGFALVSCDGVVPLAV